MRQTIKAGLAVLVLSLGLATPVAAGPSEDAGAAYNRGDYATALRLWLPLAVQGAKIRRPQRCACHGERRRRTGQFHLGQAYRVRSRLAAGGRWIRTFGPRHGELCCRR